MKREQQSFDNLFRKYYTPLLHFAMQYIPDKADCHDIVNDVFEEVWRNYSDIKESNSKSYLFTCVRNRCIDFLRKDKQYAKYANTVEYMSQQYIYEEHLLEDEDNTMIINMVLEHLTSPTREILEACYMHDKKYREVAQEMNISISTVKKHMTKALKILREIKKSLKT